MPGFTSFTGFVAGLIAIVAVFATASRERALWRELTPFVGLAIASVTRDLLWIYVGFELTSFAREKLRARDIAATASCLAGLMLVVLTGAGTDPASIEPSVPVMAGVGLLAIGLLGKWLQTVGTNPYLFVGAALAWVGALARCSIWSPGLVDAAGALPAVAAGAGMVAGGIGAAVSTRSSSFVFWLTVSQVFLAVAAIPAGVPALPAILMHLAASTLAIALIAAGGPSFGCWLAALSLASVPPFPGFVSKVPLLASLPAVMVAIAAASAFFAGIGCARELARIGAAARAEKSWASALGIVMILGLALFPETAYAWAVRAASGLF